MSMKVLVERQELAAAVGWAAHAVPDRSPTPALLGLLLRAHGADGGSLTVSGYGHDVSASCDAAAEVTGTGSALVSGRLLSDLTRALPEEPVELSADGAELSVRCGPAEFALPVIPMEDYPRLPDVPEPQGVVDAARFAEAVAQVAVATARDETLPMLTGIWLEAGPESLRLTATDRYRLAVRDLPWRPAPGAAADPVTALVPARDLLALARSAAGDGELSLSVGGGEPGGLLALAGGRRRATSRLISSGFITYRKLFPESYAGSSVVERRALQAAVKRLSLVAEGPEALRLTLGAGSLTVEIGEGGAARGRESVPAEHQGPEVRLAADRGYVQDALAALTTPCAELSFNGPGQPAVFTGRDSPDAPGDSSYRYLVMLSKRR